MQCKEALIQLNALADGEARGWKRVRLRRHLKLCPFCAAAYSEIQEIGIQAQAWRNVSVPPDLQARTQNALGKSPARPSAFDHQHALCQPTREESKREESKKEESKKEESKKEESKTMAQTTLQANFVVETVGAARPAAPRALRSLAALSVALLVAGALAFLHSGRQAGTAEQGVAFAAVRQAMQKLKTIHFRATQVASEGMTERQDGLGAGRPIEYWVRLAPYATVWHDAEGARHLQTAKGEAIYDPKTRRWETDPHSPADTEPLDFLFAPDMPGHPAADAKHWVSTRVQEQGRDLTRFRASKREQVEKSDQPPFTMLLEYMVLADPQTRLVVRSELKLTQSIAGKEAGWVKITLSDFRYNETPPNGTFDLRMPNVRH